MPPETTQPLVSIQIPTYNRPEYLALSLRSAIEQTYENLEILVSDDASPDREVEAVVREVAAGDPRVRYVRQPENLGNIANFVWALRASRGEYCKALCDDDLIAPTHVERLLAPMVDDPRISFAFSYFQHIDAHGRVQPDPPGYGRWAQSPKLLPGAEFAQAGMPANMNLVGSTTATLFPRRRLALPHLGRFGGVAVSHYGADWSIWLGLLASGPAFYSPEPLSQTREHEGRVTHDARHIYDRVNDLLVIQEQFASFAPDIDRVAKMSALNMITGIAMQSATAHADAPDAARVLDVAERALGHVRRLQAGGAEATIDVAARASIVVVAGADADELMEQLQSIIAGTAPAAFEVVLVVDATASAEVRALVAQLEGDVAIVERDTVLDAAELRAAGAEAAARDVVVLLTPGTLVQSGWLPRLLDCFVDEDVHVACSGLVVDGRGTLVDDDGAAADGDWSMYELRDVAEPYPGAVAVSGAALDQVRASGTWADDERIVTNPASWVRTAVPAS